MGYLRMKLGALRRRIFCDTRDQIKELSVKVERMDFMLRSFMDIRNFPKATGRLRLLQQADAALLKRLTDVLTQHGIDYWLISGTLLGAVRHKGFVPWDDDVDICVKRSDYRNLEQLLNKEFPEVEGFNAVRSNGIRFRYSGTPCQIDIFPYDFYSISCDDGETAENEIWRDWRLAHEKIKIDWSRLSTDGQVLSGMSFDEIDRTSEHISNAHSGERMICMNGFEVYGGTDYFTPCEALYPLKEIEFEGMFFKAPHNCDKVLSLQYGDYMKYPKQFIMHDDIYKRFSDEAVDKMRALIGKQSICG